MHSKKGSRRANSKNETMVKRYDLKTGSTEDLLQLSTTMTAKNITSKNFQELLKFSWNYVMQPKLMWDA